jgi:hypothetical protein
VLRRFLLFVDGLGLRLFVADGAVIDSVSEATERDSKGSEYFCGLA